MSTGYDWEGLRQVCAALLGARHVPERLCSGLVNLGCYNKCSPFYAIHSNSTQWDMQDDLFCARGSRQTMSQNVDKVYWSASTAPHR